MLTARQRRNQRGKRPLMSLSRRRKNRVVKRRGFSDPSAKEMRERFAAHPDAGVVRAASLRRSKTNPTKLTKAQRRLARQAKLTRRDKIVKILENQQVLIKGMSNFQTFIARMDRDEEAEMARMMAEDAEYGSEATDVS